jgi:tripartite-type tricarboxylate transporter receptor subunit TctC
MRVMTNAAPWLLVAAAAGQTAHAQTYPVKPIRLVVPFPAGGGVDFVGRVVAQKLGEQLGQTVVVDNRPGAAGSIGADNVAKSPADGYALLISGPGAVSVSVALYPKLPYDPRRDFAPISNIVSMPYLLVIHPSVPARTPQEFVALARARPGKLNMASGGTGTGTHLTGEWLKSELKFDMVHVSYKGTAPALNDLLGGHADLFFSDPSAVALVRSGRLRAIAVTTLKRYPALPDTPTLAETVAPGFESSNWYPLLAPANTPKEIVARLQTEVHRMLAQADVRERLATQGFEPDPGTPEALAARIRTEIDKWTRVVRAANIRLE